MELVRQRCFTEDLPPPPEPFPLHLLAATISLPPSVVDESESLDDTASEASDVTVQYDYDDMTEINLIGIQRACVDALESLLPPNRTGEVSEKDQRLATTLGELLEASYELETFHPSSACCSPATPPSEQDVRSPYLTLVHVLLAAQAAAAQRQPREMSGSDVDLNPSIAAVFREELAWARVESLSHAVVDLVRQRDQDVHTATAHALPPTYRRSERDSADSHSSGALSIPPSYNDHRDDRSVHASGSHAQAASSELKTEKPSSTRMTPILNDLDTVTHAIERLNSIAPQLEDQRAVLRPVRRRQPSGQASPERLRELEGIWDKIERANGRTERSESKRQSIATIKPADIGASKPRQSGGQDLEQDKLFEQLFESSGRMSDQDVAMKPKSRKEDDLVSIIDRSESSRLSSQDFPMEEYLKKKRQSSTVRRPTPLELSDTSSFKRVGEARTPKSKKHFLDALGSAWLSAPDASPARSSFSPRTPKTPKYTPSLAIAIEESEARSRPSSPVVGLDRPIRKFLGGLVRQQQQQPPRMVDLKPLPTPPVDAEAVSYVCEHQENLRAVVVTVYGIHLPPTDLQLEVASPGDAVITSKNSSLRVNIALPTPVPLGQKVSFLPCEGFLEAKLAALPTPPSVFSLNTSYPLSAPNLRQLAPRSLCCAHCEREIAEFPANIQFKDLPSEHWAEMLEVWMCHSDPAFTAHIAQHTKKGFWPSRSTVLVGASYLLIAGGDICNALVRDSSHEEWNTISCPCGEALGKQRCDDALPGAGTLRLYKWPISLMRGGGGADIERVKYPVSTFVVSEMLELSQAHASHRFAILDENGQRRLAVWLFNPSVRLAYRRPGCDSPQRLPSHERSSGDRPRARRSCSSNRSHSHEPARSLRAAKIMYRVLGGGGYEHLPGFTGQVETLTYPAGVCEALIQSLQASTNVYPPARRGLGAFDSGFLERV